MPSASREGSVFWWCSAAVVAAAFLPALIIQYTEMWSDPDYNFFPLLWLGAGVLAWRDTRTLGQLEPGHRGLSWFLLGVCWLLLLASAVFVSPWLGCVIAQVTLLVAAYAWGGGRLVRAILPAWLLLGLLIPRYGLDYYSRLALQRIASRWSSLVLDRVGVYHLPQGNLIVLPGRRLLVEEACSGIHSLFVILAAVGFFGFWRGYSPVRLLALLVASAFWVVVVNTGRIVLVIWAVARTELDLVGGWRHEAVGLAVVVVTLGLLASTDRLFAPTVQALRSVWSALIVVPWREWRRRRKRRSGQLLGPPFAMGNAPAPAPAPAQSCVEAFEPRPAEPTRWPLPGQTALAGRVMATAYAGLAVVVLVLFWPAVRVAFGASAPVAALVTRLDTLAEESLPATSGAFRRLDFHLEERESASEFGKYSRIWSYAFGTHQAVVSVDYPFGGWHELTQCYTNGGWTLLKREGVAERVVDVSLNNGTSEDASLLFSVIDVRGRPVSPSLKRRWYDRLAVWEEPSVSSLWDRLKNRGYYYQVQLLVTGGEPLTAEESEQAFAFFREVRDLAMRGAGHVGPVSR